MSTITIEQVNPQAGIRGGRVKVECQGLDPMTLDGCQLVFGSTPTRPALTSTTMVLGTVPDQAETAGLYLQQQDTTSNIADFSPATLLAENLHPVANPVVDRQGIIYTTISGTKGQQTPVSIYRILPTGEVEPFVSGIVNPTGLAFGPDGDLYVSSRHTGKILRVSETGTLTTVADNLGIVTGIAFDSKGQLHLGDRRGTIQQLSGTGKPEILARLEPSITAYHLAFDDHDRLYVSYPTLSGYDRIVAVAPDGEITTIVGGLGRAQGIALDQEDNLYAISHIEGDAGVIKITPTGEIELVIAGVNLVGLAFGMDSNLILADNSALYKLEIGIQGRPLHP